MAFQFRFQSILQLRRRERDQAAIRLAEVTAGIAEVDSRIQTIRSRRLSVPTVQTETGVVSAAKLRSRSDYVSALRLAETELVHQRGLLEERLDMQRRELVAAQLEVARLEKLLERERKQFQADIRSREQREQETLIAARYAG